MRKLFFCVFLLSFCALPSLAQRSDTLLEKWEFMRGGSSVWEEVTVPHDWAISGPFDEENDLQSVAVVQDGETRATRKTGRTGGLPYVGTGFYRTRFKTEEGKVTVLLFEGAMSRARVMVNGTEVIFWPYGYNSFWCEVTPFLNATGQENLLEVSLENLPQSSRWYPGAGLYRPVHLVTTSTVHIPVWGTFLTTPRIDRDTARVRIETQVEGLAPGSSLDLRTRILDESGEELTAERSTFAMGEPLIQELSLPNPRLWSPESPALYTAESSVMVDGKVMDVYRTRFGVRSAEFVKGTGFLLNGHPRKFRGVCLHHDLGPLGAAVNESAIRHQLELLKDMGCDAIRTTHNMPAPVLVRLCEEMGFMLIVEPFDEWDVAKCKNGYHLYFDQWAEKDMVNMLHQFRNSPAVVLWSIGNEVPTQCSPDGARIARFLQDICHREDPTRAVTCGMDRVDCILSNGFGKTVDVPGLNYRTFRYKDAYDSLPQGFILGSETASTVSSRGVYHLPARLVFSELHEDHQCSSYDLDACSWSNVPDIDFALADDYPWTLGQFVWTGMDYLGEPSPYSTDAWPNHSSMFGIIDLASLPKDRFWLYRSVWNTESPTLHVLPHWNWEEGQNVPVFVYTSWPSAELFVNGESQGRLYKQQTAAGKCTGIQNDPAQLSRYRLIWDDVIFHKGEIRVVAYDDAGTAVDQTVVRTAGQPHHIILEKSFSQPLSPDGKTLSYITVSVVDKLGNLCPDASPLIRFKVGGAGRFVAVANGDPTCLEPFQDPQMHAFNGKLTLIVSSREGRCGSVKIKARARSIRPGRLRLK